MSEHTKGPWTDYGYSTGDIYGTWPDDGSYHQPIIECDSGVYGPYGADRSLILSAPDMYEALKEALAVIRHDGHETGVERDAYDLIEMAIAKAEGKS